MDQDQGEKPGSPAERDDETQEAIQDVESPGPARPAPLRHVLRRGCQVLALAAMVWIIFRIALLGLEMRGKLQGAMCHKNLLQVSLALNMYAQDWDGRLPPSSDWMDSAHTYTRHWGVLHCPALGTEDSTRFGYAMNNWLAGRSIEKVRKPETIPLVYDSSNLARNAADPFTSLPDPPRHRENRAVYLDHQVRIPPLGRDDTK